jgi:hypothetical protein
MSLPIFDREKKLAFCLQVISKKKKNSTFSSGFTMFDEIFFTMTANIMQIKLHNILARNMMKESQQDVINIIKTAAVVST